MKLKHLMRRILATTAALSLTVALALPAFAAPGQEDGSAPDTNDHNRSTSQTITVKAEAPQLNGVPLTAYQLLDVINNPTVNTNAEGTNRVYVPGKGFGDLFPATLVSQYGSLTDDQKKAAYITFSDYALSISGTGTSGPNVIGPVDLSNFDTTFYAADLVSRLTGQAGTSGTAADIAKFSNWVSEYIKNKSSNTYTTSTTSKGNADTRELTISDVPMGYYLVLATKAGTTAGEETTITQSILNLDNSAGAGDITLKAKTITLTKSIKENDVSAQIGETLTYTLETQLPDLTYYDESNKPKGAYKFEIADEMTNQRMAAGTFKVTIDTDEYTATVADGSGVASSSTAVYDVKNTDPPAVKIATLTVKPYADKKQEFTLAFEFATMQEKYAAATTASDVAVKVEYLTYLTEDAVSTGSDGANPNPNTATLTYSNDPYTDSTDTLTSSKETYTYGIELDKTFSDGIKTADYYNAVTFDLYAEDRYTTGWSVTGDPIAVVGSNGVYHVKGEGNTGTAATGAEGKGALALDSNGSLKIFGLDTDQHTYYLVEKSAPNGFNKVIVRINLTADSSYKLSNLTSEISVGEYQATETNYVHANATELTINNKGVVSNANKDYVKFSVRNQKGFVLPTTGGEGIWVLTIGGVLLTALGCFILFPRRKKQK